MSTWLLLSCQAECSHLRVLGPGESDARPARINRGNSRGCNRFA